MRNRKHLVPCILATVVAITLFATVGSNPLAAGVGLAFLICPIVMGTVMWLLMRQPKTSIPVDRQSQHDLPEHSSTSAQP
jgi:hypothetical protein